MNLQLIERIALLARLTRDQQSVHRSPDQHLQVRGGKRLGQVVERPLTQRLDARLDAGVTRHHDDHRVVIGPERGPQQGEAIDLRHVQVYEHQVEGAALQQVEGFLPSAAHGHVVAFVAQHRRAALPQRVFVIDHQNPHAGLGLRPDGEHGRRFPSLDGGSHAVMSKRYGHRGVLDFRLTPLYAGFGPTCRRAAATGILRTTTTNSAGHRALRGVAPAPRCIRRLDAVHRFAAWGECGLRAARYRTCHREGGRRATRRGPPPQWRYAFR